MGQKLVIVESPAKAKTIKKYLGANFIVEASMGHIRDLPKSQLGVDVEHDYNPKYITIRGKGDLLDKLKKAARKSEQVYLATDPDREGEAISWHLAKALDIKSEIPCRIEFNEITKNAVKNAIKNPRRINENLVDAQQARRIVDRLVGYEISPILWKKVKWGLSAGRVQSVALKLICDREEEVVNFVPKEYWTIETELRKKKGKQGFKVKLSSHKGKKIEIDNEDQSNNIIKELEANEFVVKQVKKGNKLKNPLPPFTTSTLQQDANRKLNFSTKKTMSLAQQLYEGVEVKGKGSIGLITYMRTDSVRISEEAQKNASEFISSIYGNEYMPKTPRVYKGKKNAQDAHEAIRPSYTELTPEELKDSLSPDMLKLYTLIWNRFIASQMASCVLDVITVDIANGDYLFKASGSKVKFDGFMRVYEYTNEEEENSISMPELDDGEILENKKIEGKQHFTQPPFRFTEASLVKTFEENGIGRPSTYATIFSTLLDRKYVEREKKNIIPTELGKIVNTIMCENFKNIVDVDFTAELEDKLDNIEEGKERWQKIVDEFFKPVMEMIGVAEKEINKITIEDKVSDVPCDKCGSMMVIKQGRFGEFLACPSYPECKNTKAIVEELDVPCPKCSGKVVVKRSRKGKKFFGCENYPNCDFVSWFEPTDKKCEKCGSLIIKKYSKAKGNYFVCSNNECKHVVENQS